MPTGFIQELFQNLPRLTLPAALDILLVAYLIYQLLLVVRGTRAAHILLGLLLLGVLYYASRVGGLETLHSIMDNLIPYSMLAVIVLFQSEIRRTLGRLGRRPFFRISQISRTEAYDDVLLAVTHLSQARIGALIVLERDIGLRTFIESGVGMDARLSYDLLLTIFHPGAPLHDGAAIIQQDKVAAAACFLPLTTNPTLASQLGTRHRAAIGVTEESDCIAFVVSEQDGRISVASGGAIELGVSPERLRERLSKFSGRSAARLPYPPAPVGELTHSPVWRHRPLKTLLRRFVFNNLGLKLLSLASAVFLWALIAAEPELETTISVPVEFHNVPKDLEITSDIQTNVHLQVKGSSGRIRNVNRADVAVVLDLLPVNQPGTRTFSLDSSQIVLPRGIDLVKSVPSQIRLVFEKRLTRDVRVLPRFTGTYAQGYEIAKYTVDPPTLKVVGPESRVALLDYVTTDPIDLTRLVGSASFPRNTYLDDPDLRFENLKSVRVHVVMTRK